MKLNRNMNRNREAGFSLIELLIVVAIMLIIAAIAIPAVANSVRAARESAAAQTLRTANTAEQSYSNAFKKYAVDAKSMGDANSVCVNGTVSSSASCDLDNDFATTLSKSNYTFTRIATDNTFMWVAVPAGGALDGRRVFCMIQGGTIHATDVGDTTTVPSAAADCVALKPL